MKITANTSRDELIKSLLDGRANTLIELAHKINKSRNQTQAELNNLQEKGIVHLRTNRKRLYYFMPSDQVSSLKKSNPIKEKQTGHSPQGMNYCRHCYNHLAGYLGVQLTEALVAKNLLIPQGVKAYKVTEKGWRWFSTIGIEKSALVQQNKPMAQQCLDFSERKSHLKGVLGEALLDKFLEQGYLKRMPHARTFQITTKGQAFFKTEFDLVVQQNKQLD